MSPAEVSDEEKKISINASTESSPGTPATTPSNKPRSGAILQLPDDLLSRIFAHFDPAPDLCLLMEVCTKFAKAASVPELWRNVTAVDPITRRAKKYGLKTAALTIVYGLDDSVPPPAAEISTPEDRRRYRKGAGLAVDVITSRGGSHLTTLDIQDCYPNFPRYDHQLTDADIELIAERCSASLKTVFLSGSLLVTTSSLLHLAKSCPKLRTLHIIGFECMGPDALESIAAACPTLEDISVRRCEEYNACGIHDELAHVRNSLKRLDISETRSDTIQLATILDTYPVLEEIIAADCSRLSSYHFGGEPESLSMSSSITSLNFNNVSVIGSSVLGMIWTGCPQLRSFCLNTKDAGRYEDEIPHLMDLHGWPPLRKLHMAGHSVTTDQLWQRIFERLGATLVECDLSRSKKLTCHLDLFRNDSFAELEDLRLQTTAVTEETVKVLMGISPKLKSLDLSGCAGVDREMRKNPLAYRDSKNDPEVADAVEPV